MQGIKSVVLLKRHDVCLRVWFSSKAQSEPNTIDPFNFRNNFSNPFELHLLYALIKILALFVSLKHQTAAFIQMEYPINFYLKLNV